MEMQQDAISMPAAPWRLSPGAERVARFGMQGTMWVALVALYACCALATAAAGVHWTVAVLLGVAIGFANVAIHEAGHLVGARATGMFVVRAQVGSVEVLARRRGWRVRWKAPVFRVDGFLMACPDPRRPLRRQLLAMAAGGPVANAVTGLAAILAGALVWGSATAYVLVGAGLHAMLLTVANLVPVGHGPFGTDGLKLRRWFQSVDERDPDVASVVANGLAMTGVTADRMPPALMAVLAEGPVGTRLLHLWMTLFAHLNRERWGEAAALAPRLDALLAEVPEAERPGWADFAQVVRAEMRFAAALAGDDAFDGAVAALAPGAGWHCPAQRPRFEALHAALAGDAVACRDALARSAAAAADSADPASRETESRLRAAVEAVLAARVSPAVAA